jgi:chromosome partitioning protein
MEWSSGPGLGWPESRTPGTGGDLATVPEHLGLGWPGDRSAPERPPKLRSALAAVSRETAPAPCGGEPMPVPGPAELGVTEPTVNESAGGAESAAGPVDWSRAADATSRVLEADSDPLPGTAVAEPAGPWIASAAADAGSVAPASAGMRTIAAAANVGEAGYRVGESEVQVAIPSAPDAVADTPIARAAQAAVVARAGGVWPRPPACRIITIANQKGGVGKTTTAVNIAASLAMHGARVLVVDLDPQGNASTALDVDHRSGVPSVYNVLVDGMPLASVVRHVDGYQELYCVPASIDLAGAEIELVPLVAREARLARALGAYDASGLDYIFIDCPPSLGLLTVNALVAAPEVLIPIQCEYYALEGLEQLLRTVDLVRSHLNPTLGVSTILLTMFDARTRLASQVADEVREHFGPVVLGSVIPRSVRVSEAPSYGQSVMTYDPGSTGALAYLEAARELAQRSAAMAG